MSLEIRKVLKSVIMHTILNNFDSLYYKIKAQELIYLYFVQLFKRPERDFSRIGSQEIEQLLYIEQKILNNLDVPPQLSVLAREVGMSETKMKQLFKKVFGSSIYNCYQTARIKEAAFRLKTDPGISIADIGNSLGFTNLSHFARVFKTYFGCSPKEYALTHQEK